ncbi:MAG TPA: hypothetical protein VJ124_07500 [Pyrinomonadaceae bacterium]|nr:hypothetical protein [Pyrinomonadaceae bacterium]
MLATFGAMANAVEARGTPNIAQPQAVRVDRGRPYFWESWYPRFATPDGIAMSDIDLLITLRVASLHRQIRKWRSNTNAPAISKMTTLRQAAVTRSSRPKTTSV